MTNIRIIGENNPPKKKLKPIKLVKILDSNEFTKPIESNPKNYKNVELICRNYFSDEGYDLIFCYDVDRNNHFETCLFLGYWNDGVVES